MAHPDGEISTHASVAIGIGRIRGGGGAIRVGTVLNSIYLTVDRGYYYCANDHSNPEDK